MFKHVEFFEVKRRAAKAAIEAAAAAAQTGDGAAEERWLALLEYADYARRSGNEAWLRLNPWWDIRPEGKFVELLAARSAVATVVPIVRDEPAVSPEAPDPLPAGPVTEP